MKLRVTSEQLLTKIHQVADRYDLMKYVRRVEEENEIPSWERDRSTFNPAARELREAGQKETADLLYQQVRRLCDALTLAEHFAVGLATAQRIAPVARYWRTEAGTDAPGMAEEAIRVCRRYLDGALEKLEQIERTGRAGKNVHHWQPKVYPGIALIHGGWQPRS
jgi:hypothetical protein